MNKLLVSLGVKPRRGVVIVCPVCHKQAYKRQSQLKPGRINYCSSACYLKALKDSSHSSKCAICGKEYKCVPSQHYLRNRKCCSNKCSGELRRNSGEKKSGNRRERYWQEVDEWRKKVFAIDNYTCQICDKRGGYIEAHHILQWAFYPEYRTDTRNGITLCENCHYELGHSRRKPTIKEVLGEETRHGFLSVHKK